MTLNCRPGQLARIIADGQGCPGSDIGKLVLVTGPGDDWSDIGDARFHWMCDPLGQDLWMHCGDSVWRLQHAQAVNIPDCQLKPIGDIDGEDEMLRIAGKPRKAEQPRQVDMPKVGEGYEVLT